MRYVFGLSALTIILVLGYAFLLYIFGGKDSSHVEKQSLSFDERVLTFIASKAPVESEGLLWGAYKAYEFYDYGLPPIGTTALSGIRFYSRDSIDAFEEQFQTQGEGYWVGYRLSRSQWDEITRLLDEGASTSRYSLLNENGRRWVAYQYSCTGESCFNRYFSTLVGDTMVIVIVTFWQDSSEADNVFRESTVEIR